MGDEDAAEALSRAGVGKTELSRRFGVSPRLIHYWIATGQLDRDLAAGGTSAARRRPRKQKLDPYKTIIDERLRWFPRLSAQRLFDEVRAAGYPNGYGRVRDYVSAFRSRDPVEAEARFETPPGRQGQVDFGDVHAAVGPAPRAAGGAGPLAAAVAALLPPPDHGGAVRRPGERVRPLRRRAAGTAVRPDARGRSLGRPRRRRRADPERGVPALRGALGLHAAIVPTLRARTKGKVERPIRYLRGSFFYGREFASDADLLGLAAHWLDATANVRVHGTTGERPLDRFERDERRVLGPRAGRPYRRLGAAAATGREGAAAPAGGLRGGRAMKAAAKNRRDRVRAMLADLKMPGALEVADDILAQADGGSVTTGEAVEKLLGAQIELRNNRRLASAMRSSRLPAVSEDAPRVRLRLPAQHQARADREPARARLRRLRRERDPAGSAGSGSIVHTSLRY